MSETKKWWKSLTIIAVTVCMACFVLLACNKPKQLDHDFTLDEFCDWAEEESARNKEVPLQMIGVGAGGAAVYGRKRAKKEIT